jgi:hypothetical protein
MRIACSLIDLKIAVSRLETQFGRLSEGQDKLYTKVDGVYTKVDGVSTKVDGIKAWLGKLYEQFNRQHKRYTEYMSLLEKRWKDSQEKFVQQGTNIMAEVRNALALCLTE